MKITAQTIRNVRFRRCHLRWFVWTLRKIRATYPTTCTPTTRFRYLAEDWADALDGHVRNFDRERFINAVLTGED